MTCIEMALIVDRASSDPPDTSDFISSELSGSPSVESVMMTTGIFSTGDTIDSGAIVGPTGVEGAISEIGGISGETLASKTADAMCLLEIINRMKGTSRLEGEVNMSDAQFKIIARAP